MNFQNKYMNQKNKLIKKAEKLNEYMREIRRKIHSYPEPGFEEVKTASLIAKELKEMGVEFKTGIAKTGVTALIKGNSPGPTVGIRADMDALSMKEETGAAYASTRPGFMHACGHDGHVACLLGTAKLLKEENFSGNIKLIFQPAEEGPGGASVMIEEGVLKDPPLEAIIAAHLDPEIEKGKIAVCYGQMYAACTEIAITINGEGGHAASPHRGKDAICMASEAIISLQKIVSRQINPFEPVVITIGTIKGGSRYNILAHRVVMEGTVRCFNRETNKTIAELMKNILDGVVMGWQGTYNLEFKESYPPLINDNRVVEIIEKAGEKLIGSENIHRNYPPNNGGEDFSFFTNLVPGAMFIIGTGEPDFSYQLHHPKFDFNEDALITGSAVMAGSALDLLKCDL